MRIADVIEQMRAEGLPIVYSDNLVSDDLLVQSEPEATAPVAILEEILAAHSLALQEVDGSFYVIFVPRDRAAVAGGSLLVLVRDSQTGAALHGATVRVGGGRTAGRSLPNAAFQFADLAPGRQTIVVSAPGYVAQQSAVEITAGGRTSARLELEPESSAFETITVTASRYDLKNAMGIGSVYFSQEVIEASPGHREDPIRVAHQLPGVASTGYSAQSFVRGGDRDETAILFDGIELLDPFHIRDFQNVFSTLDQYAVEGVEVYTGGFPVQYGSRMSGVIAMNPVSATTGHRHAIGLSALNTSIFSNGRFQNGRADWLLSARRSNLGKVLEGTSLGKPDFNDVFAHVGYEMTPATSLSLNGLLANDRVLIVAEDQLDERNAATSNTRNSHIWARATTQWNAALASSSTAFYGEISNRRDGIIDDPEKIVGFVQDDREIRVFGLMQDWSWQSSDNVLTRWGFDWRQNDARYDYLGEAEYTGIYAAYADVPDSRRIDVATDPEGNSVGVYVSQRRRLNPRWFVEAGLRWDQQTYLVPTDSQLSPRLSLLYRLNESTDLRLSLGRYFQAEGIHELQVEDGVDSFSRAQRADHVILGMDYRPGRNIALRIEAFNKEMSDLRPRFENSLSNLELLAELEPDRTRVAPESATARGLELLLSYNPKAKFDGWARYSWSEVFDEIDGREVPRYWDQRHAAGLGLNWTPRNWTFSAALHYHSGWPVTGVSLEIQENGMPEPELITRFARRNGQRLGSYLRADVRVSRWFDLGDTRLQLFAEISNLQDRFNPCCVDYDIDFDDLDRPFLDRTEDAWLPLLPELGIRWEF